jgi:predicted nucleotidyltransferase
MAYTKNEAVEIAKTFLIQAAKKHPIRSAYLFGSYAKGIQRDYSDIDIAAVFSEAIEQKKYYEETVEIFHEAQEYNSTLEVICFREDEFEKDGGTIVAQIKKEGVKIELS